MYSPLANMHSNLPFRRLSDEDIEHQTNWKLEATHNGGQGNPDIETYEKLKSSPYHHKEQSERLPIKM